MEIEHVAAVLAGLGLAACAGLRVFLPLLAAGLAARFLHWELAPAVGWLSSDTFLIASGVATFLEILADKIPFLDHMLDAIQTVAAPVAGVLASVSAFFHLSPDLAWILAILGGAGVAGGVHFLAAATRVKSSVLTAGLGNPILSFVEDALAFLSTALAILAPLLLLVLFVIAALGFRGLWRRARGLR